MSTNLATKDPKKPRQIKQFLDAVHGIINNLLSLKEKDDEEDFYKIVMKAKQELNDAQIYFDSVTDKELVDHAIYRMEAAKSHYTFLIKQAKAKGIRINI